VVQLKPRSPRKMTLRRKTQSLRTVVMKVSVLQT